VNLSEEILPSFGQTILYHKVFHEAVGVEDFTVPKFKHGT
jgi:hypothetical protein